MGSGDVRFRGGCGVGVFDSIVCVFLVVCLVSIECVGLCWSNPDEGESTFRDVFFVLSLVLFSFNPFPLVSCTNTR